MALSDPKYGLAFEPSVAVAYLMNEGYYASATWYQPKLASSYTTIARYGKDDFVGAYCMQGAGSTSYFQAPYTDDVTTLTGAVALAASLLAVGTLALAM